MFSLTRFTGEEFFINPDMIKFVEYCGDTVITLITGERVLVRESMDEVKKSFMEYKRQVGSQLPFLESSTHAIPK